jgi:hypothetical protein
MENGQPLTPDKNQNAPARGRQHSLYVYDRPHAANRPVVNISAAPIAQPQPTDQVQVTTQPAQPVQPVQPQTWSSSDRLSVQPRIGPSPSLSKTYIPYGSAASEPIKPKPKVVFKPVPMDDIKPVWEVPMPKELELENKPLNMPTPVPSGKLSFIKKPKREWVNKSGESPQVLQRPAPTAQQPPQQFQGIQPAIPNEPPVSPQQYATQAAPAVQFKAVPPALPAASDQPFEQQFAANAEVKKRRLNLKPLAPKAAATLGALVLVVGAVFGLGLVRNNNSDQDSQIAVVQEENDVLGIIDTAPLEVPPTASVGMYNPEPDEPRSIIIRSINVAAQIVEVGASNNNRVKAPINIYDLGWFNGSAKPGNEGAVVLNGHVAGPTKHGTLYSISKLKSGDKIELESGNGGKFTYTIQAVETFENDDIDMSKMLTSYTYGRKGLNIMTVGGRFNSKTNQYELRYAVYATQDN